MLKKSLIVLAIAGMLCCRARRPELTPPDGTHFRSLGVKFSFREKDVRQSGRIVWRFDGEHSKFIFFTPLNQIGLELDVSGEDAVLANFTRKECWQGDFHVLLERMWGIDMSFSSLKALLLAGEIPRGDFAAKGIEADMEPNPGGGAPRAVRLRRGDAELSLRLTRDEYRPGKVVLAGYEERYRAADLESVLAE